MEEIKILIAKFQLWLDDVEYKDWGFEVCEKNEVPYLQIKFLAPDNDNPDGPLQIQSCRKWQLSQHMTKSEFIQTAFKAVMTAEEHEIRETFLYKDKAVFAPHLNVDELWKFLASRDRNDIRKAQP